MKEKFENPFEYKIIYIFTIDDKEHKGLLKIGDATLKTDKTIDKLSPNSKELNKAALDRIKSYTNTAGVVPILKHTELAIKGKVNKDKTTTIMPFRDYEIHRVLINSGIEKRKIKGTTGKEWFKIEIETARKAIDAVKKGYENLSNVKTDHMTPIIFRPEQEKAIAETIKKYEKSNKMLWNAKMRFGKTLSALQVVKKMEFKRTLILTHRPVVDDGWYEDFNKIFYNEENYIYGSRAKGNNIEKLRKQSKNFVYFASIQDLRGSSKVGGKFDKNDEIFDLDWDFVILDEAHEGTTTALGKEVLDNILKRDEKNSTKFLALSGTPFNILDNFEDNVYTWDYIMEQESKMMWDEIHFGDSNPYEELPELKIYTYNLGDLVNVKNYMDLTDKAFNFKEFFRTWVGNIEIDGKAMPSEAEAGDFVHEKDIQSFLNLITKESENSYYPYSNKNYRDMFKHSLWMIPGVKEAKALSKLMNKHSVFGSGLFNIVNVAGDGDEEEKNEKALKKVKEAIKNSGENYTITLSCGKLTTGVTIPEWTGVFMISGSCSTSAANYLQTIFRVQSPCKKDGKIKNCCYVFDFAPDRTLKMVAEAATLSTKAGKTTDTDKKILGKFLNYCPIISIDGTVMKEYDPNRLLEQLKKAYAERTVMNGFDDTYLYNDELLKLTDIELKQFSDLKRIVGETKANSKTKEIDINNQGFTNEEYEEIENLKKKKKQELTKEEKEKLKKLEENKKQRSNAISILRGISIRMPLLIYGVDIPFSNDITIDNLSDIVDGKSWEEFMPKGVTKELFKSFIKYYDKEIFTVASRKIRDNAKNTDFLYPLERLNRIVSIFSYFKNPDKETVLTPWRVVNMHIGDCLGGYSFYNKKENKIKEEPCFINKEEISENVFNEDSKILEINSKTGLYPLYAAYSIFRKKRDKYKDNLSLEEELKLWDETLDKNIYVICKTPMAKSITKRTLCGYRKSKVNSYYFEDLVNMMVNKSNQICEKILRPEYWNKKGEVMKFDAIIGNPPYQEFDGGAQASAKPIYQYFVQGAKKINPDYISLITPSRWYVGGKGLDEYREEMLNDKHLEELHDWLTPADIFPNTNIRGGICYFIWNSEYNNLEEMLRVVTHKDNEIISDKKRALKIDDVDIFVRDNIGIPILEKIEIKNKNQDNLDKYFSARKPFGLESSFTKNKFFLREPLSNKQCVVCYGKGWEKGYVDRELVQIRKEYIDRWKIFTARANNIGIELPDDNMNVKIGEPNTICTETYLCIGAELNLNEKSAMALCKYIQTKFVRYLHGLAKGSQDATAKTYKFVPLQDFTDNSDINWNKNITDVDKQLYRKYNLTEEEIEHIEKTIKPMK